MTARVARGLAALVLAWTTPAFATYSIVASDSATREVGGAGTSCLRGSDVIIIYGAVPGVAAVHAQARFSQAGRDRAVELIASGESPQQIIAQITAPDFDSMAETRQYGIADVSGRTAAFTGSGTGAFAGDRTGQVGSASFAVQGNILTSEAVLTQAAAGFAEPACDLAERLLNALEAGARNGEGDSRCTPSGIPSDSAFLAVERPDLPAGGHLLVRVPTSGSADPIPALRAEFEIWRAANPCPSGGSGGSGGANAGGGAGEGGSGGAGVTGGSAGLAGSGGGGAASAGAAPGEAAGRGGSSAPGPGASSDAACGCRGAQPAGSQLPFGLVLALLIASRARRATNLAPVRPKAPPPRPREDGGRSSNG